MSIATCTPSSGPATGGTHVTLGGADFVQGMAVEFDGVPATDVVVSSGTDPVASWAFFNAIAGGESMALAVGDTITVGTQVYTFQDVLTDVAGNMLIGADNFDSMAIFARAVVGGPGRGTYYADSTPVNADAEVSGYGSGLVAHALVPGVAGDSIPVATTCTTAIWHGEGYGIGGDGVDFLCLGSDGSGAGSSLTCVTPAHAAGAVDVVVDPGISDWTLVNGFTFVEGGGDGWIDIADFRDIEIRAADFADGLAHARVWIWTDVAATIQARVWNITDGISMGESTVITSTTPTMVTINVLLTATLAYYRLQVTSNLGSIDLWATSGQLIKGAA